MSRREDIECGRLFPGGRVDRGRPLSAVEQGTVDELRDLSRELYEEAHERMRAAHKSPGRRHQLLAEKSALEEAARRCEQRITKIRQRETKR